jgi:Holliday junction DNA helicase RuvA
LSDGYQKEVEMIATLDGTLEYSDANSAIVKVGGIGFKVYVSRYTLDQLGDVGSSISIYTHFPKQLVLAITSGSVDAIVQVPGIGKKVASRLIVELKGKFEKEWGEEALPLAPENAEAVAALTSLGYSLREASQALSAIQNSSALSLEDKVRLALQQLGTK